MKLTDYIEKLKLKVLVGNPKGLEVDGIYVCDLLSHCIGKLNENDIWITVQNNINVAAVCHLAGATAILLPENIMPDDELYNKAKKEDIVILQSGKTAYQICGFSRELGVGD